MRDLGTYRFRGDRAAVPLVRRQEDCPRPHLHTPCPRSYIGWHLWAEKKSRRHYQVRCPGCGFLTIWRRKPKGVD